MKKKFKILSLIMAMVFVLTTLSVSNVEAATVTHIGGTVGQTNEGSGNLFDGNVNTKWCVTNFSSAMVMWKMSSSVSAYGYSLTTANDNSTWTGRNPKSWTLYGCNSTTTPDWNSSSWKAISTVSNSILKDVNYTTYTYTMNNKAPKYNYYKLVITSTQGASVMQLSEFNLKYTS